MRILGIDPGTSLIGYGIIDTDGRTYTTVDYGTCTTPANIKNVDRVVDVFTFFDTLIKKHSPDIVSMESLFFAKNTTTALKVSEIRGVLLLATAKNGLEVREFTPLQVKQAVSSYGRADKGQVQRMVEMILGHKLTTVPDDTYDAIAIAICCANTTKY